MKTKTIYPPVEVFDDPEYCDECCDNSDRDPCDYLDDAACRLFFTNEDWAKLDFDYDKVGYKKCSQCKKVFQETK